MSAAKRPFAAWGKLPHTKRKEALQHMRKVIALLALSIVVCGCSERGGQPRLEPLARGLGEAWQPVARDLKLEMHAANNGEQVTMHCVLKNVSANAIEVDASTLPWNNADLFSVSAVAADGKVVMQQQKLPPVRLSRISVLPRPVAIASGESMEGRIDLGEMPISNLPRNEDLLLLWSYQMLKNRRSDAQYMLSGVTLLNASTQTPTVVPKPLPGSALNGTSVSP
jgi:hypothetical protein